MAKLKALHITPEVAAMVLTKGKSFPCMLCKEGLPEGAVLVNSYINPISNNLCLVFHHESFEDLLPGEIPPFMDVVFQSQGS